MALSLFPRFGSFFNECDQFGMLGPGVHMRESDDALIIEFEVPRYRAEDLRVEVRGDTVIVSGQRPMEQPYYSDQFNQFLYGETPSSSFRRALHIPHGFDPAKVAHELHFGVLTVTIQRRKAMPTERLPIGGTSGQMTTQGNNNQGTMITRQTDARGLTVSSDVSASEFNAISNMRWPPKLHVDDSNDVIKYTCELPQSMTPDHVDLSLRGRSLNLTVNHHRRVQKKDRDGNVMFNEEQQVSHSTPLLMPEGTTSKDISTEFKDGNLVITVSKHQKNVGQKVPVAESTMPSR